MYLKVFLTVFEIIGSQNFDIIPKSWETKAARGERTEFLDHVTAVKFLVAAIYILLTSHIRDT
jgi:hypothetical protein